MIKNLDYIKYTYLHRKSLIYYINTNKYLSDEERENLLQRAKVHDMDKMTLYLFWDKKDASNYHRTHNGHHVFEYIKRGFTPDKFDILESIFDYECAALTKPDKPLNAFDTLRAHYPSLIPYYEEYMERLNMNSTYCAITDEALSYINSFEVSEEILLKEVATYLTENKENIYTTLKDKCCSEEEYSWICSFK